MALPPRRRQQDPLRTALDQSISEAAQGTQTRSRASRARAAGARVQGRSRARARSAGQCREAGLCTEERHSAEPLELASQTEPASTRSGSADKTDRHHRPTLAWTFVGEARSQQALTQVGDVRVRDQKAKLFRLCAVFPRAVVRSPTE